MGGTRGHKPRVKRATAERLGYIVAVLILVVGGALVRTPILNWISGPAIVVLCAAGIPILLGHPGDAPTDESEPEPEVDAT
jgi:hypothetical protein